MTEFETLPTPDDGSGEIITAAQTATESPRRISPPLGAIFLRSLMIQTLMNYTRMQGLNFGAALAPLARKLNLKGRELAGFLRRHFDFYNAHPYLAGFALGAAAKLEIEGEKASRINEIKNRLMGPLGLLGDQVFWAKWKPLCSAVPVIMIFSLAYPPNIGIRLPVILILAATIIVYNILSLGVRWLGLKAGFAAGALVHLAVSQSILVKLRLILGLSLAFFGGLYLTQAFSLSGEKIVFASSFLAVFFCKWRRIPLWLTLLLAMSLALAVFFVTEVYLNG